MTLGIVRELLPIRTWRQRGHYVASGTNEREIGVPYEYFGQSGA